MRAATLLAALVTWGCGLPPGGGPGLPSGTVYLYERDVPCEFVAIARVDGVVTVRSLNEYERRRDQLLLREAQRLEADAVLIPEDRPEPGRGRVGLALRRTGGVTQPTEVEVEGVAIRLLTDSCADPGDNDALLGTSRQGFPKTASRAT